MPLCKNMGSDFGFVCELRSCPGAGKFSPGGTPPEFRGAPEAGTGSQSAQFTVNAMYVTGQITGASVHGDTATLTGIANITGLGAGSNVSFTFVVEKGGPGATSVLTVGTLPTLPFHEILLNGSFDVAGED